RYFSWKKKAAEENEEEEDDNDTLEIAAVHRRSARSFSSVTVFSSKLRLALSLVKGAAVHRPLGTRVIGTLFGQRHGLRSNGKILEEPFWRAYCNEKKAVHAVRWECRPDNWKVLNTLGPITTGLGVLPSSGAAESVDGEMIYIRAKFERATDSNDSEALYMIIPDDSGGTGGPEVRIYLLRGLVVML
ncbi:hypothetical protein MIMGU_mgv1a021956mg, partial [Erythranthe guttata]